MRTWPALEVVGITDAEPLQVALADCDVAAVHERSDEAWTVFFHAVEARNRASTLLGARFPGLAIRTADVPDDDWAARSQHSLHAIRIGRIIVAPPWDVPDPPSAASRDGGDPLVIVIEPSMGFGTGHHATTRLCLQALQQHDLRTRTVVDVGTGSGVLAIAAARLGASRVLAIDDDPDAVEAARENVRINDVAVDVTVADFRTLALAPADLVLANLTGGLLIAGAGALQRLASRRAPVIVSGFTTGEEAAVLASVPRLRPAERAEEDEWVCLTLQHESGFE